MNQKMTQGIALMILTAVLVCSTVFTADNYTEVPTDVAVAGNAKAGIVASLEQTENTMLDQAQLADVLVAKTETQIVTVASKKDMSDVSDAAAEQDEAAAAEQDAAAAAEGDAAEVVEEEPVELSKTEQEWQDKVMADVDDFLCIRTEGNADAEVVGKLYPTSVATVVKQGKTWTQIKSGDVKGYVKNEYLLFGMDAYNNAKKVCKKYAYVQTNGLRVRSKANEDAQVISVADKKDRLLFNKKADKKEGWVAVTVKAGNGYVSADYVKVKLGTTDAVSIAEEIAAQKAKEAAERAAAASASVATQHEATSASVDDTTLLAAIIQCEAGSECYEGKVAVGAVVLNRVCSGSYPNSISGVIYQRSQFGPASNGSLARVLASGNISSSCRQAAADALAGSDPTGGRKNFHRVDGSNGLVIGNHVFF